MELGDFNVFDAEGLFAAFAGEMEVVMDVAVSARVAEAVFAKARTVVNFVNYMVFRVGKKAQRAKNTRPVHRGHLDFHIVERKRIVKLLYRLVNQYSHGSGTNAVVFEHLFYVVVFHNIVFYVHKYRNIFSKNQVLFN